MHSASIVYVFRLRPHEDLKKSIVQFARDNHIKAGIVITCVGSLEQFNLRFANRQAGTSQKGHFEIVSAVGTFSDTASHIHVSVANGDGEIIGGHLLEENFIYTTAEIAVASLTDLEFDRQPDSTYGYHELLVKEKKSVQP